jgi:hypothetical protein
MGGTPARRAYLDPQIVSRNACSVSTMHWTIPCKSQLRDRCEANCAAIQSRYVGTVSSRGPLTESNRRVTRRASFVDSRRRGRRSHIDHARLFGNASNNGTRGASSIPSRKGARPWIRRSHARSNVRLPSLSGFSSCATGEATYALPKIRLRSLVGFPRQPRVVIRNSWSPQASSSTPRWRREGNAIRRSRRIHARPCLSPTTSKKEDATVVA